MRGSIILLLSLMAPITLFAQVGDQATATYSKGGKLLGVSNLIGLSDCSSRSAAGKVSSVETEGDTVRLKLKQKKESFDVEAPLARLAPDDRAAIVKDLLRKKITLRVAGYACSAEGPITAFSIDRVY